MEGSNELISPFKVDPRKLELLEKRLSSDVAAASDPFSFSNLSNHSNHSRNGSLQQPSSIQDGEKNQKLTQQPIQSLSQSQSQDKFPFQIQIPQQSLFQQSQLTTTTNSNPQSPQKSSTTKFHLHFEQNSNNSTQSSHSLDSGEENNQILNSKKHQILNSGFNKQVEKENDSNFEIEDATRSDDEENSKVYFQLPKCKKEIIS